VKINAVLIKRGALKKLILLSFFNHIDFKILALEAEIMMKENPGFSSLKKVFYFCIDVLQNKKPALQPFDPLFFLDFWMEEY